jgi:hypothetical protein
MHRCNASWERQFFFFGNTSIYSILQENLVTSRLTTFHFTAVAWLQLLPRCLPTPDDLALFLRISNVLSSASIGSATDKNTEEDVAVVDLPALRAHQGTLRLLHHVWLQLDSNLSTATAAATRTFDAVASLSAALQRVHTRDTSTALIARNSPLACRCVTQLLLPAAVSLVLAHNRPYPCGVFLRLNQSLVGTVPNFDYCVVLCSTNE